LLLFLLSLKLICQKSQSNRDLLKISLALFFVFAIKEETALIKLTFFDTNQTEKKIVHETSIVKSKQLGSQLESEEQLELLAKADYNYLLEINLLDGEEIVGGYKGAWNLPWNKLNGAQEIILPVINIPNPSEEQMIELILGVEEQSKLLPAPEIK